MSYDLHFRPRNGKPRIADYLRYFQATPHFKVDAPQAVYENEDTGVYFVFEVQEEPEDKEEEFFPISLNLNYFRPSFFGLEAETQVRRFVREFDMLVSDPQRDGMGDGEYNSELFLRGWNCGNEFGYRAILRDPRHRMDLTFLPVQKLVSMWSWNFSKGEVQQRLGKSIFVPRISVVLLAGSPVTIAVWPDAIPIAVPEVDVFLIIRKRLAHPHNPTRPEDRSLLCRNEMVPWTQKYWSTRANGLCLPNFDTPPRELKTYLESLPSDTRAIAGVARDQVLDQELVEKCSSGAGEATT